MGSMGCRLCKSIKNERRFLTSFSGVSTRPLAPRLNVKSFFTRQASLKKNSMCCQVASFRIPRIRISGSRSGFPVTTSRTMNWPTPSTIPVVAAKRLSQRARSRACRQFA